MERSRPFQRLRKQLGTRARAGAAVLALVLLVVLVFTLARHHQASRPPGQVDLPEFNQPDSEVMKAAFFAFLRPIVRYHNERIAKQREWLLRAMEKESRGWFEERRLRRLAEEYRVDLQALDLPEAVAILIRRVDVVPESLALIQAAKESGWGRSRFSREGNMLFGERCFREGCGIVPDARPADAAFEVASFPTAYDAVGSYLRNLNTHPGYTGFRRARQVLRESDEPLSGVALARHLGNFSERGDVYVQEIIAMILENDLEDR